MCIEKSLNEIGIGWAYPGNKNQFFKRILKTQELDGKQFNQEQIRSVMGAAFDEAGSLNISDPILFFKEIGLQNNQNKQVKRVFFKNVLIKTYYSNPRKECELIVFKNPVVYYLKEENIVKKVAKEVCPAYLIKYGFDKQTDREPLIEKIRAKVEQLNLDIENSNLLDLLEQKIKKCLVTCTG